MYQDAGRPGDRTYCYAELAVSSPVVAETIISSHCAYPRRDDQAEFARVAGYITRQDSQPSPGTDVK